jgi:hypothetical protein
MDIFETANKEKAARRRLFNSKPVIVDQAAAINLALTSVDTVSASVLSVPTNSSVSQYTFQGANWW